LSTSQQNGAINRWNNILQPIIGYNIVDVSIKRNNIGLPDPGEQINRPNIIILYNGAILAGDVHRVTLFRRLSVAYCVVVLSTPFGKISG
jgi:hypothetical protein